MDDAAASDTQPDVQTALRLASAKELHKEQDSVLEAAAVAVETGKSVVVKEWQRAEDGQLVKYTKKQTPIKLAYEHYVAQHGVHIKGDEKADMKRFVMLQFSRSTGDHPHIIEQIEKATSAADLDKIDEERRNSSISLTEFFQSGDSGPGGNAMDMDAISEESGRLYRDLVDRGVLKQIDTDEQEGTTFTLDAKTPDEKRAKIEQLQRAGYHVYITKKDDLVRSTPTVADEADRRFKEFEKQVSLVTNAIKLGMPFKGAEKPNESASTLAAAIDMSAETLMQSLERIKNVTRCDGLNNRLFHMPASKLANAWADMKLGVQRVDKVLPLPPDLTTALLSQHAAAINRDLLFYETVEHMFYTPQLYMLLSGGQLPRMAPFSNIWRFYGAVLKHVGSTDLRRSEKEVQAAELANKRKLERKKGVKLNPARPDSEARAEHSRDELWTLDRNMRSTERVNFVRRVRELRNATLELFEQQQQEGERRKAESDDQMQTDGVCAPGEVIPCVKCRETAWNCTCTEQRRVAESLQIQFLQMLHEETRRYCLKLLRSRETLLMLFFEDYIPIGARHSLLTPEKVPCQCCMPAEAVEQFTDNNRLFVAARNTFAVAKADQFAQTFKFDEIGLYDAVVGSTPVDKAQPWAQTFAEMVQFARFLDIDFGSNAASAADVVNDATAMLEAYMHKQDESNRHRSTGKMLLPKGVERHQSKTKAMNKQK